MKIRIPLTMVVALLALSLAGDVFPPPGAAAMPSPLAVITLPAPMTAGCTSVETAMQLRRSARDYRPETLRLTDLGQLLWACQGVTNERGNRTAPSAGATYPLEIYLVAGTVEALESGIYHYDPQSHSLELLMTGDIVPALAQAAGGQPAVSRAAAVIVITAVYERTTAVYGSRGRQFVHIEVGAAAQNVSLQAVAFGLGTVYIGSFTDRDVQTVLRLPADRMPLLLLPIGKQKE